MRLRLLGLCGRQSEPRTSVRGWRGPANACVATRSLTLGARIGVSPSLRFSRLAVAHLTWTLPGFFPDAGDGVAPAVAGFVLGLLEPPLQARAGVGGELRIAGQPGFELPAQLGVAGHHAARDRLREILAGSHTERGFEYWIHEAPARQRIRRLRFEHGERQASAVLPERHPI